MSKLREYYTEKTGSYAEDWIDDDSLSFTLEYTWWLEEQLIWKDVRYSLPDIDEYVLWRTESGYVFMDCIDKDSDEYSIKWFLACNKILGPITHWMRAPEVMEEV